MKVQRVAAILVLLCLFVELGARGFLAICAGPRHTRELAFLPVLAPRPPPASDAEEDAERPQTRDHAERSHEGTTGARAWPVRLGSDLAGFDRLAGRTAILPA